jgi:hypothetical protein
VLWSSPRLSIKHPFGEILEADQSELSPERSDLLTQVSCENAIALEGFGIGDPSRSKFQRGVKNDYSRRPERQRLE